MMIQKRSSCDEMLKCWNKTERYPCWTIWATAGPNEPHCCR